MPLLCGFVAQKIGFFALYIVVIATVSKLCSCHVLFCDHGFRGVIPRLDSYSPQISARKVESSLSLQTYDFILNLTNFYDLIFNAKTDFNVAIIF